MLCNGGGTTYVGSCVTIARRVAICVHDEGEGEVECTHSASRRFGANYIALSMSNMRVFVPLGNQLQLVHLLFAVRNYGVFISVRYRLDMVSCPRVGCSLAP